MSFNLENYSKIRNKGMNVQDIHELETLAYGDYFVSKTADPITTSTTGARNVFYGPQLWAQFVIQENALGAMAKRAWGKSGRRMVTAPSFGTTPSAGHTQGAALPDTKKPTFAYLKYDPKEIVKTFEMSLAELSMEGRDDTIVFDELVKYYQDEILNEVNQSFMKATSAGVAGINIESLDRMICSYDEKTNSGITYASNVADMWGNSDYTRDSEASVFDAYVNHNSGVKTPLALNMIDVAYSKVVPFWGSHSSKEKVFITGYDTDLRLGQLIQTEQRYVQTNFASMDVEGIQTLEGVNAGIQMAAYKNIPIIPDNYASGFAVGDSTSASGIGRIYLVDKAKTEVSVAAPFMFFQSDEALLTGTVGRKGLFTAVMELTTGSFKSNGKVMNIC